MSTADPADGSAALGWLIAACGRWLGGAAPPTPPPDWNELARHGFLHQLDPLLHALAAAGRIDAGAVPAGVLRRWREALFKNYIFNAELLELGASLVGRCGARGLALAFFKGPVTAARGYGALELRIMADLDLLCRERDLGAVADEACALGFRPTEQTADYHLGLIHPGLGAGLELHFRLYDVIADRASLLEQILARPDAVRIEEATLPAPPPELAVVLDLAHLVHHDYRTHLRALLDLAATLGSERAAPDAEGVEALVRRSGLERELARLLRLFERDFAWPVPAPFRALAAPVDPDGFGERVIERLLHPAQLERRPLLAGPHAKESSTATGRYLLRRLFPSLGFLQARYRSPTPAAALLRLPHHVVTTLRRGLARWRGGGLRARGPLKHDRNG